MTTPKDTDIREALRRKYAKVPQMKGLTPDLHREWGFAPLCGARATFSGSSKDPSRPLRGERVLNGKKLWPWMCAIAASIIVAFFLWPNSPAVVEQPVVAEVVEQPAPEAPKASDYSESSDKPTPSKATNPKRTCEDNKPIKPQDEPLLAETETPAHDDIDIAAELADLKNEINELEYLYLSCNN